jgi:hypothetical protein
LRIESFVTDSFPLPALFALYRSGGSNFGK